MKNINENTNVTTKGTPSLNMITPITTSIPSYYFHCSNYQSFPSLQQTMVRRSEMY